MIDSAVNSTLVYRTLTFAGAIPFVGLSVALWLGVDTLGPLGMTINVLLVYGLAILSFLCGTQWAFELSRPGMAGLPLFLISNAIVVVAWLTTLAAAAAVAFPVQFLAFALVLMVDGRLRSRGVIDQTYWRLRQQVSAIVLLAILAAAVAVWQG